MRIVLLGPFGLGPKMTMKRRALPLARALAARGHIVRVVLPPWDCPESSGLRWQEAGVDVVNVRLPPRLPAGWLWHLWLASRLLRAALSFRPQIVHCFKPKAYAGLAAMGLRMLQTVRVWRGRLMVDADDWEGAGGWNDIAGYSWQQRVFFAWQERWGFRWCDGVTVASRWLERRARELRPGRAGVWYVPNGVESSLISEERDTAGLLQTALLYTRFVEFDLEQVVDVWGRVIDVIPEARLLVIGDGLRGEKECLHRLMAAKGLGQSVDIIGWAQEDQLNRLLEQVELAMMPVDDSVIARAKCSVRVLELLEAGIPVVCSAVGEYAEMVQDGVTGMLVAPGDVAAMAGAMVILFQNPCLRRSMGRAAQTSARTAYAWERLSACVEEAYRG